MARAHRRESLNLSRADHRIMHKIIVCAKSQDVKKIIYGLKKDNIATLTRKYRYIGWINDFRKIFASHLDWLARV